MRIHIGYAKPASTRCGPLMGMIIILYDKLDRHDKVFSYKTKINQSTYEWGFRISIQNVSFLVLQRNWREHKECLSCWFVLYKIQKSFPCVSCELWKFLIWYFVAQEYSAADVCYQLAWWRLVITLCSLNVGFNKKFTF